MTTDMYALVRKAVQRYHLIDPGDTVLVGVSGGPDSMALLHILHHLQNAYGISLIVAHYHHGLRGDASDRDAVFVEQQARVLGIPYMMERAPESLLQQSGNLEERARRLRYAFFERAARFRGANKTALGHNANDQAETILLWLFRGAGRSGMTGIPPMRDDIIRPLIDIDRKGIICFLTENRIPWVEDRTNTDINRTRNNMRHRIIPVLEQEFGSHVLQRLRNTADILRDEEQWLQRIVNQAFHELVEESPEGSLVIAVDAVLARPIALQRRILRQAVEAIQGSTRRLSLRHVEAVISLLHSGSPHAETALPYGITARRVYGRLAIGKREERTTPFFYSYTVLPHSIDITELGKTLSFELLDKWDDRPIRGFSGATALIDWEKVRFPLVVRNSQPGDRFHPLGAPGRKKVTDFFGELKMPIHRRNRIPLVIFDGGIVWVAGYRINETVKITSKTKRALKIELQ